MAALPGGDYSRLCLLRLSNGIQSLLCRPMLWVGLMESMDVDTQFVRTSTIERHRFEEKFLALKNQGIKHVGLHFIKNLERTIHLAAMPIWITLISEGNRPLNGERYH